MCISLHPESGVMRTNPKQEITWIHVRILRLSGPRTGQLEPGLRESGSPLLDGIPQWSSYNVIQQLEQLYMYNLVSQIHTILEASRH